MTEREIKAAIEQSEAERKVAKLSIPQLLKQLPALETQANKLRHQLKEYDSKHQVYVDGHLRCLLTPEQLAKRKEINSQLSRCKHQMDKIRQNIDKHEQTVLRTTGRIDFFRSIHPEPEDTNMPSQWVHLGSVAK